MSHERGVRSTVSCFDCASSSSLSPPSAFTCQYAGSPRLSPVGALCVESSIVSKKGFVRPSIMDGVHCRAEDKTGDRLDAGGCGKRFGHGAARNSGDPPAPPREASTPDFHVTCGR